jgi:hypothetical protein
MLLNSIASLNTGTYTVTRTASGSLTQGRFTPGGTTTLDIEAVVQPYSGGRKMLPLPEGIRAEDTKLLHTTTPLRTADNTGEADKITILGDTFVVWAVQGPYTLGGSTHYEAYVTRRTVP